MSNYKQGCFTISYLSQLSRTVRKIYWNIDRELVGKSLSPRPPPRHRFYVDLGRKLFVTDPLRVQAS